MYTVEAYTALLPHQLSINTLYSLTALNSIVAVLSQKTFAGLFDAILQTLMTRKNLMFIVFQLPVVLKQDENGWFKYIRIEIRKNIDYIENYSNDERTSC